MSAVGPTFAAELQAAGLAGLPFSWTGDGQIIGRDQLTDPQRAALDAVLAAHDPNAVPKPTLTGASLLDVLSDGEAAAVGVKPRDLLRLAARAGDVVPATNPKLQRLLQRNPTLTYDALLARLPGSA